MFFFLDFWISIVFLDFTEKSKKIMELFGFFISGSTKLFYFLRCFWIFLRIQKAIRIQGFSITET